MATSDLVVSEPTGSPQEYGFPEHPTSLQIRTWTLQEKFLTEYAICGGCYKAAAAAGHTYNAFKTWVELDKFTFQKRYQDAQARYFEKMELEADRRAITGVDQDIFYQRDKIGTKTVYSDNLLMFRMKKLDPSYRDNYSVMEDVSAIRESLDALRQLGVPRLPEPKVVDETGASLEPEKRN